MTTEEIKQAAKAIPKPFRRLCWTKNFNVDDFPIDIDITSEDEARMHLAHDFISNFETAFASTRYSIAQVERGEESGRIHIQGYSEWATPIRLITVLTRIPCLLGSHFELPNGNRTQCRDYCRKARTQVSEPVEVGDWDAGGQGHRSDMDGLLEAVREGKSDHDIAMEYPKGFLLYGQKIQQLRAALKEKPSDSAFQPKPWQQELIDRIKAPADDRTIIWVLDSRGGQGKSRLARHLYCEYGACLLSGRLADMAYMYQGERVVVFDITRAAAEHSDHLYSMAEAIKNRTVISTKYMSTTKYCTEDVHVIFFSNSRPQEGKWSEDRVTLINLDT